jgi:hypothetical protein
MRPSNADLLASLLLGIVHYRMQPHTDATVALPLWLRDANSISYACNHRLRDLRDQATIFTAAI